MVKFKIRQLTAVLAAALFVGYAPIAAAQNYPLREKPRSGSRVSRELNIPWAAEPESVALIQGADDTLPSPAAEMGAPTPENSDDEVPAAGSSMPGELPASSGLPSESPLDGESILNQPAVNDWGMEPPAPIWSSGDWFRRGVWYTAADFTVMHRNRPNRKRMTLGIDASTPGRGLINYGTNPFGVEPGVRATVGRFLGRDMRNRDHSLEFTFLYSNEFNVENSIRSRLSGSLFLEQDTNQPGFNFADTYTTDYRSNYFSYDLNYRIRRRLEADRLVMSPDGNWTRQYTRGLLPSLLLGIRYVTVDEYFQFSSRRDDNNREGFGGDYLVNTDNDLAGIQIGGELIDQHETWYWGVRVKAGPFVNFSEQHTEMQGNVTFNGPNGPFTQSEERDETATASAAAFVGEVGFVWAYHVRPNWTLRASYDMMWVAGLALAPDQVSFNDFPTPQVLHAGSIWYQGLSLGTEIVW